MQTLWQSEQPDRAWVLCAQAERDAAREKGGDQALEVQSLPEKHGEPARFSVIVPALCDGED